MTASVESTRQADKPTRRGKSELWEKLSYVAYPTAFVIFLVGVWQWYVTANDVSKFTLPPPMDVLRELIDEWDLILENVWPTFQEVAYGFIIASVLGILIAVLIASIPIVERTIYPVLVGLLVVPKIAIAPLFVIWFGFGVKPKVIIVVLLAFFPIVVDMALGLKSVPEDMIALCRSMGASRLKTFWKVRFVYALPNLFVGLKVAMALAVVGAVVGEFVQSSEGLGYRLLQAQAQGKTDQFFAVILVLTAMGVLLYLAVDIVERVVLRSRRSGGDEG